MPKPFVFVYLPKTGATRLLGHLGRELVWNEGIVFLGPWGDRQRHREGRPDVSVWSEVKRSRIRVVTGTDIDLDSHRFAGGDEGRYFTIVRDPAERLVAEYQSLADRGEDVPGFWEWHSDRRVNQATRQFRDLFGVEDADAISERLRGFWYVTTTEHLDEDAPHLLEGIGVGGEWTPGDGSEGDLDDVDAGEDGEIAPAAARSEPRVELTDELRERIYQSHPKDRRLHKLALKRRASKRERFGWA